MAIYFREFCVGWTIFLMCLFLVSARSSLHDELYYGYNTLESTHRSLAELDINFIDKGIEHSRHRRNINETSNRTSVSQSKPAVNSTFQNSQSSNVASSFNKVTSLSSENAHDLLTHISSGRDIDHSLFSGGMTRSDPSAQAEIQRLQTLKQAVRTGPAQIPVPDTSTLVIHNNNSVSSASNNTYTSPNSGQIVSAAFEANSKNGGVGSTIDAVKDKETDIAINQFADEISNATFKEENITKALKDNHIYYNSTFIVDEKVGQQYWVELSDNSNFKIHEMLSQSHRRAATVQLSFDFPFYGHLVTNVTIATGGFLFTGDHIHSWLAATQYIAPLMANFDNRISEDAYVKYLDNGTAFIVLWENVVLKDSPEFGNFTFEAILHKNGDIVFIYKNIPVPVENIKDDQHPVKVGLSDAYIIDRTIFFVKRKTIYEYHRVNFSKEDIKNWTVIYLNALPTCHDMRDCEACLNANINLECKWCPEVKRCSTGLDRARQEWLSHECDKVHVSSCSEQAPPPYAHRAAESNIISTKHNDSQSEKRTALGSSGVISLLLVMTSLAAAAFIFLFAYRNPHSAVGQLLIRYRPSQWRWRRGEARYTAATIHM